MWRIVVQAWNIAAQEFVCPEGGLIAGSEDVPVAMYVGEPVEVMLTSEAGAATPSVGFDRTFDHIGLTLDPGSLSWGQIADIYQDDRCHDAMRTFREASAMGAGAEARNAFDSFARAAANVAPQLVSPIRPWMWGFGTILVGFGSAHSDA